MKQMRRFAVYALIAFALISGDLAANASNSNVSYSGNAGQFVFTPGSDESVTDLFTEFKDVMPGDTLKQTIVVRNNASDKNSVKIYLRALGAHEQSQDFLSQLTVVVSAGDSRLFSAPADQKAQLDDWVELGELGSGGAVELTVTLQVPVTLENSFMDAVGYLDWQFMVEEFPVDQPDQPGQPGQPDEPDQPGQPDEPDQPDQPDEPDKPIDPDKPDVPKTGDGVNIGLFAGLFAGSGLMLAALLWLFFKKKEQDSD